MSSCHHVICFCSLSPALRIVSSSFDSLSSGRIHVAMTRICTHSLSVSQMRVRVHIFSSNCLSFSHFTANFSKKSNFPARHLLPEGNTLVKIYGPYLFNACSKTSSQSGQYMSSPSVVMGSPPLVGVLSASALCFVVCLCLSVVCSCGCVVFLSDRLIAVSAVFVVCFALCIDSLCACRWCGVHLARLLCCCCLISSVLFLHRELLLILTSLTLPVLPWTFISVPICPLGRVLCLGCH